MPKLEAESPSIRRKSSRAKRLVNNSMLNDLPPEVVNSMGVGKDDMRLPPGYNVSDDSEDDYKPAAVSKGSKRRDDSDVDSEEESLSKKTKKPRRRGPGRKSLQNDSSSGTMVDINTVSSSLKKESGSAVSSGMISKIKSEPGKGDEIVCVVCKEVLVMSKNPRFHYSVHFFEENAFIDILTPLDLKDGKPQDVVGKVHKYTCRYDGCTKRRMGYKELCVHLSTAHQILRTLMSKDKRPEMKEALDTLFPPEDLLIPAVKVKQEKGVIPSIPKVSSSIPSIPKVSSPFPRSGLELEDSEDVDDPSGPSEPSSKPAPTTYKVVAPSSPAKVTRQGFIKTEVKKERKYMARPKADKIHHCVLCNGNGKHDKEGRNLNLGSGLHDLKYHYAACVYDEGGLLRYVEHGQGKDKKVEDLEAFGSKYKYKCPFENCAKNQGQGRNKAIGYKEYAIHCAVWHHQLEKWFKDEKSQKSGLEEVYEAVVAARKEEGTELEEMPKVIVEEMHTCMICNGEDKDGKNLSFEGNRLFSLRYHYAACFYEAGYYRDKYPPGPKNTKEGQPIDELGKEMKYQCEMRGCTVKRKMGYKEFAIHMSNEHGGLEEVIEDSDRPEIRALTDKIKKRPLHNHS